MSKPVIQFEYAFSKLQDRYGGLITEATLLQVLRVDISTLTDEFLEYETGGERFRLTPAGEYLLLIFISPQGNVFNLLKPASRKGIKDGTLQLYYDSLVGQSFDVVAGA